MHCLLFTGEETFLVWQEVYKRTSAFAKKHGSDNIHIYNSEQRSVSSLTSDLFWSSLFAQNKLIIIYGIAENHPQYKLKAHETEAVTDMLLTQRSSLNPDNYIIFVTHKPDKRTKARKFLSKEIEKQKDFGILKTAGAKTYVTTVAKKHDLALDKDTVQAIVALVWTNAWRLWSETHKLISYHQATQTTITPDLVHELCYGNVSETIFVIMDALVAGKSVEALTLLDGLAQSWTNWNEVYGGLYRNLRLLIMYCEQIHKGTSPKAIAKTIGAPPFTVLKRDKHRATITDNGQTWQDMLQRMIQYEHDVKTGKHPDSTAFLLLKDFISQSSLWK